VVIKLMLLQSARILMDIYSSMQIKTAYPLHESLIFSSHKKATCPRQQCSVNINNNTFTNDIDYFLAPDSCCSSCWATKSSQIITSSRDM